MFEIRSKPFWRADVRVVEITDFLLYFQKGDQYFGLGNTFTAFERYRWVLKLTIVVDRNSTDSTQVPGLKNGQYHRYQFNYVGTSHKLFVWSSARNTMDNNSWLSIHGGNCGCPVTIRASPRVGLCESSQRLCIHFTGLLLSKHEEPYRIG